MAAHLPASCQELLDLQHGVIARWQAQQVALSIPAIDDRLRRHHWQPLYCGVYAAFTGQPSRTAVLWGAVLRAGPGAVLSHRTAAELDLLADPGGAIHVTIPTSRRIRIPAGEYGTAAWNSLMACHGRNARSSAESQGAPATWTTSTASSASPSNLTAGPLTRPKRAGGTSTGTTRARRPASSRCGTAGPMSRLIPAGWQPR